MAARIGSVRPLALRGEIAAGTDLSGVAVVGDFLVLGADEGHQLQILVRGRGGAGWRLQHTLPLAKRDQETDIEAITFGDGHLYVVGSHSFRRRRMLPELPARRNRKRLLRIQQQRSRNRLYRLSFDTHTGEVGEAEHIDLSKRLRRDPLLKHYHGIPGKENGIDIEGMAFRDGRLWLGFRGPVLRENYVPVMIFRYDRPKRYALNLVRLDGQGIRDMVALDDGLLILSGPVNDAPGPYRLWWWDGEDQVPGKDRRVRPCVLLGAVSAPAGAKAEGLGLLGASGGEAEVVVLYETDSATQAVGMRVSLPR